jgi:pyruvate kinase
MLLRNLDRWLLEKRMFRRGDILVVLMGDPLGKDTERTNLMRLHRVGAALA